MSKLFCKMRFIFNYAGPFISNETFYNWLRNLAIYGVSLIKNASTDEADCRRLVEKVAFIRKTHYGQVFTVFDIKRIVNDIVLVITVKRITLKTNQEHKT